ncbi:mitochondrial resolvase Ydc2 [Nemania sp. FL0031]|nr:mitochondrial resolvase Ydc2 [Nemania sp. FL0031]
MAARGPALVIPRSLRAEQLKRLSFLCGLPVGGRKDDLIARLTAAAAASPAPKPRSSPAVLSIDLGIRNLAFSLLTPAVTSSTPSSRKTSAKSKKRSNANAVPPPFLSTSPPPITLHAWQRLSLLENPASQNGDEPALDVDTTGQFAPATLAQTANFFLRETVLKLNPLPTHILIERQRWRSGGAAAIQEWTVRVNTLEAMLHASLRTMRDVGVWKGDVVSIRPERVGLLFLDAANLGAQEIVEDEEPEEDEADTSTGKSKKKRRGGRKTSAEAKKLKIGLLGGWLSQGDLIIQPGSVGAGHMLDAYRDASTGTKRSKSKRAVSESEEGTPVTLDRKLDDLTDSLMQGMAWLRWRENIALLQQENGVEQLLGDNR